MDDHRWTLTRRQWLAALPAIALTPPLRWPAQLEPVRLAGLHSVALAVSDVARSTAFYQALFGMPVQARRGRAVALRIGTGPAYLELVPAGGPARFGRIGVAVSGFDPERVVARLTALGLERVAARETDPGPLQVMLRRRGETAEVLLGDPHGQAVRLGHPDDCGGGGAFGERCRLEPAPDDAPLRLTGISHFTNNAAEPGRAVEFYRGTFGLDIQAYQAASPLLEVGGGPDFLMFIGGTVGRSAEEAARRPGSVHHACLSVADFGVERVQAALEGQGVRPLGSDAAGPLRHWLSMRMPNRGGAPEGTPELYFSDPDGLAIQLQDATYCGGGGYLGDVCD